MKRNCKTRHLRYFYLWEFQKLLCLQGRICISSPLPIVDQFALDHCYIAVSRNQSLQNSGVKNKKQTSSIIENSVINKIMNGISLYRIFRIFLVGSISVIVRCISTSLFDCISNITNLILTVSTRTSLKDLFEDWHYSVHYSIHTVCYVRDFSNLLVIHYRNNLVSLQVVSTSISSIAAQQSL